MRQMLDTIFGLLALSDVLDHHHKIIDRTVGAPHTTG